MNMNIEPILCKLCDERYLKLFKQIIYFLESNKKNLLLRKECNEKFLKCLSEKNDEILKRINFLDKEINKCDECIQFINKILKYI